MNKDNLLMMEQLQIRAWTHFLLQTGTDQKRIDDVLQNEGLEGLKRFGKEMLKKTTPLAVGAAVMASAPEAEAAGRGLKKSETPLQKQTKQTSKKGISQALEKQIDFVGILLDYNTNKNKKETQRKLMNLFNVDNLEDLEGALREYAVVDKNAADNVEYAFGHGLLN